MRAACERVKLNLMSGSWQRWWGPVVVLALGGWEPLWRLDPDVADGNQAYANKRYDDAVAAYERARASGVDDAGLEYDVGTAKIGRAEALPDEAARAAAYEEALGHLDAAARSKDATLAARAHYNRGNVHMKQKKLGEAIDAYKDSLRADPDLESARVNLELALRQRERQQQQQQQGKGQGQPQQGQGQGQPQDPQPGQPGQPGQPQQGQQGQPQPGQGQPQDGEAPTPPPQPGPDPPQAGESGQAGQPDKPPPDPSGQQPGQPGQPGAQQGQGQGTPAQPPPKWPHDDTEYDTPDTPRDAKLEQLEDMSRQQRRDQVRRKSGGDHRWQQEKDW